MATSGIPYVIPVGKDKPKVLTLVPNDPGSRYKTRQLQVQVVGKTKMIRTMLANILDVAKDMQVPPSYIGTFMGYEIGAQAKFDAKQPERQQAHITGEHETKDLSVLMEKFINEVVLCPVCGLPEILLSVEGKKNVNITGKCRACGNTSNMPISNEKFKNYIVKNPPAGSNAKGEKEAFKGNKAGGVVEDDDKKEKKEKKSKKKKESDDEDDDDVVWYTDTSKEAMDKRKEENIPKALEAISIGQEIEEITKILKLYSGGEVFTKLKSYKSALGEKEFLSFLLAAIFTNTKDVQADTKANMGVMKYYFAGNADAQGIMLNYFDTLCGKTNTALAGKLPLALKDLYDDDILEEKQLLEWHPTASDLVKEKVNPLVKWLQEAEEESDEEEDEDDD